MKKLASLRAGLLAAALCGLLAGQWVPVQVAWAALSATGVTASQPLPYAFSAHTVQVVVTGSPAGCTVNLDGSLDGTHWFDLSGGQTCTSSVMFHVVSKPVFYVRGDLTALSGGTAPTVQVSYVGIQQ